MKFVRSFFGRTVLLMVAVVMFGFFVGCKKSRNNSALKEFNLPFTNSGYTTVLVAVADAQGYYKEAGLDVKLNPLNGSSLELINAVTTGKIKAAIYGGTTASLTLIEGGNDLVIIGGIMSEGAALVTTPENVNKWQEFSNATLSGKKIAVTRTQSGDITFRKYLKDHGVDISKIIISELDSPPTIIQAVLKGEVDAGIVYVQYRKLAEQQGLKIVKHIDELSPGYICCRVVTTRKELKENRKDFVAFLKGQIRAYKTFKEDHARTVEIAHKAYEVDAGMLESEFYEYGHFNIIPDPYKKKIKDFYQGMIDVGYAKGTIKDLDYYIDTTLYRDALNQILQEYPNDPVYLELKKLYEENN